MILGTGIDLTSVPLMAEQLAVPGSTFLRSFTARELRTVRQRCADELPADTMGEVDALLGMAPTAGDSGSAAAPALADHGRLAVLTAARHIAARWAAKEAAIKAWSAALYGREPAIDADAVDLAQIEVVHDHWRRPALALHGDVAAALTSSLAGLADRDDPPRWHVSLSHDGDMAIAQVVLETA